MDPLWQRGGPVWALRWYQYDGHGRFLFGGYRIPILTEVDAPTSARRTYASGLVHLLGGTNVGPQVGPQKCRFFAEGNNRIPHVRKFKNAKTPIVDLGIKVPPFGKILGIF